MGVDSRAADGMELWEVGTAFGLHHPDEADTPAEPEWDPIKARIAARKAGLPEPTEPPPHVQPRQVR